MEDAETGNGKENITQQCVKNLNPMRQKRRHVIEYPEGEKATEYYYSTIYQEDTPVWQRILREIPV